MIETYKNLFKLEKLQNIIKKFVSFRPLSIQFLFCCTVLSTEIVIKKNNQTLRTTINESYFVKELNWNLILYRKFYKFLGYSTEKQETITLHNIENSEYK